uniref:Putative secreted peptide n=1 Tax=Anopheles braziliensis TaxID=58242 RepID=A0A2M3ZX10_9DIPT
MNQRQVAVVVALVVSAIENGVYSYSKQPVRKPGTFGLCETLLMRQQLQAQLHELQTQTVINIREPSL